jgi:PAH dioxygenase large subunit
VATVAAPGTGSTDRELALQRLEEVTAVLEQGGVPNSIYNDPLLFELEKENLFKRAWVFLAHESELPNPGDFVVRPIVDDSILVVRGDDGEVRAFINACRHRGSRLCMAEVGRAKNFTCIYHGWTFDRNGNLAGVPFDKAVYGGIDRSQLGLVPVAKVEICEGFVFGCLDENAMPLDDFLGDFKFYLQLTTRRSAAGLEVLGVPQRWVVEADWKIPAENLIGDAYHTPFSHRSTFEVGLVPFSSNDAKPGGPKTGVHVQAGNGDAAMSWRPEGWYMGYPPEMFETLRGQVSPEQSQVFFDGIGKGDGVWLTRWHLFPHLSCLNVAAIQDGRADPYCTLRVWQPKGPGVTEIFSWLLVEKDAPQELKERMRRAYILSFGPSGMLEQDDMENWRTISKTAQGEVARDVPQYVRMGEDVGLKPIAEWPGPGTAWPTQYFELPTMTFLKRWASWLRG